MNEDTVIGKHKWPCGGNIISWYQSGHYYHYSGIYCEKCNLTFDSREAAGIELFKKPEPPEDTSWVDLSEDKWRTS